MLLGADGRAERRRRRWSTSQPCRACASCAPRRTVATDEGFEALSRSRTLESLWGPRVPEPQQPRLHRALDACRRCADSASAARTSTDAALSTLPRLSRAARADAHRRHRRRLPPRRPLRAARAPDLHVLPRHDRRRDRAYRRAADPLLLRRADAHHRPSLEILGRMPSLEQIELYECNGVTDAGLVHPRGDCRGCAKCTSTACRA